MVRILSANMVKIRVCTYGGKMTNKNIKSQDKKKTYKNPVHLQET